MERTWRDNIKDFFFFLVRPWYWHMNNEFSEIWDLKLQFLMSNHHFTNIDHWTAKIGGYTVWICNHPYASFVCQETPVGRRPSRRTIYNAWKKLRKDCIAQMVTEAITK